jgi:hypothetical protein
MTFLVSFLDGVAVAVVVVVVVFESTDAVDRVGVFMELLGGFGAPLEVCGSSPDTGIVLARKRCAILRGTYVLWRLWKS